MYGTALTYYADWTTRCGDTQSLLQTTDGMCSAWARFLVDILMAQGLGHGGGGDLIVNYSNLRTPTAKYLHGQPEHFLVNNWNFGTANLPDGASFERARYHRIALPGQPPPEWGRGIPVPLTQGGNAVEDRLVYTHFNRLAEGESMYAPDPWTGTGNAGAYQWQGTPAVTALPGVAGQNSTNPFSIFPNHVIVKIGDVYYDPSYGVIHNSPQAFESNSIAGYAMEISLNEQMVSMQLGVDVDLNQNGTPNENEDVRVMLIRQNGAGNDLI